MEESFPHLNLTHYRIISKLGAGGMGKVYLAEDTRLDRKVALKILHEDVAAESERLRRFVQEAKAASALNHPNIITIHEIGETENRPFIAIEYIDGETLHQRLRSGPLSLKSVLDAGIQIASALQAAHEANIIHRDIKPENVMVRPDGLVKVLDFGIAKVAEPVLLSHVDAEAETIKVGTSPGMIVGTPAYMSPEQARGKPVDARTDIFSLGVVLYEMLTGRKPFEGETSMDVISEILFPEVLAALGHGYAVSGKRTEAFKIIRELQVRSKKEFIPSYSIATIYTGLGMKEEALQHLVKSYNEGSYYMIHLKVEPILDPLRADPRFTDLMRRVGH